ncbi:MAG TPA: hypothetical protein VKB93_21720 [Thermoanaerobaculia bacterium]|nr:hypothetical protein [Thermoanaerobaculia bacterium]
MSILWPFVAIVVLALVDFLLMRSWSRAYFTIGLPIFRMRLPNTRLGADAEQRLATTAVHRASVITYQRLSESEIAFREKGNASVSFRYLPLFHGLLRHKPEEGATYVIGWINLWAAWMIGLFIYIYASAPSFRKPYDLMIFFALIYGTMYAIGVWRYRMVAKAMRATSGETAPQSSSVR